MKQLYKSNTNKKVAGVCAGDFLIGAALVKLLL